VRLSDGKEGWGNAYLFALNAQLVAATAPVDLYRRPDLLTAIGERFETGELFAIIPGDNPDWVEVLGKEKKRQGWVQKGEQMTTDKVEVALAGLYTRAMEENHPEKREVLLQRIAENTRFAQSQFIHMIDEELDRIHSLPPLAENQLRIQTTLLNVRSSPAVDDEENVTFTLKEGDVCTILERGDRQQIDKRNDYWYRISFDGKKGWVFGFHTSKRIE
jgi:SH3-like domain-containing protein